MRTQRAFLLEGVTFAEFADLAKRNGWTVDSLAREFRGLFTSATARNVGGASW